jgi:small conductance mechanosensitive channel
MEKERSKFMQLLVELGFDLLLLVKIAGIIAAAWLVERLIYFALRRGYTKAKAQGREEITRYRFLRNAVRTCMVILAFFAIVYTIPSLRSFAFTLFAGAGLLVAILGFAAQKAFSDIISGIFIVAFKPFRVGDIIQAGQQGMFGTVEDINLRHTTLLTFENRRVVIPNAILGEERIVNSSIREEETCQYVEVPVAADADLEQAIRIVREEAMAHPDHMDRRTPEEKAAKEPVVPVRLVDITNGVLLLRAYVWVKDPVTARLLRYTLNERIVKRFRREGVPLALPTRLLVQRHPFTEQHVPDGAEAQ